MDDADAKLKRRVGEGMRKAREVAGLTQQQMADAAKIPQSKVSQYERGLYLPPLDRLLAIDDVCNQPRGYTLRLAGVIEETTDVRSAIMADSRVAGRVRAALVDIYDSALGNAGSAAAATAVLSEANAERPATARRRRGRSA